LAEAQITNNHPGFAHSALYRVTCKYLGRAWLGQHGTGKRIVQHAQLKYAKSGNITASEFFLLTNRQVMILLFRGPVIWMLLLSGLFMRQFDHSAALQYNSLLSGE
jgi:hypothetical protein